MVLVGGMGKGLGFIGRLFDGLFCLENGIGFPLFELREDICGDVWIGRECGVDEDCGVAGGRGAGGGKGGFGVREEEREDICVVSC